MSDTLRKPFNPPPVGEPVNLYGHLNNYYIPTSLGVWASLSWFTRVLYGALRFEAGNSDHCQVALRTLAKRFHVSFDTVRRAIDSLIAAKLIRRKPGPTGSVITFLWSERLRGSIPKSKDSESAPVLTPHASGLRNGADSATVPTQQSRGRGSANLPGGSAAVRVESAPVPGAYKETGFSSGLSSGLETGVNQIHAHRSAASVSDDPAVHFFNPVKTVAVGFGGLSDEQLPRFEEFWRMWWRDRNMHGAAKVFARLVRTADDWTFVRSALLDQGAAMAKIDRFNRPELTPWLRGLFKGQEK